MSRRDIERAGQVRDAVSYGVRSIPLDVDRTDPGDFKLIRSRNARSLVVLSVDAEAFLRFGNQSAPKVDARDFKGSTFSRPAYADDPPPFGAIYIENSQASAGDTLDIFLGADIQTAPEVVVDSIDSINQIDDSIVLEEDGSAVSQSNPLSVDIQADSAGVRQQETYAGAYTAVDLSTAGTTTLYAPANDAVAETVHVPNTSNADIRLEVTDGTDTATVADPASGNAVDADSFPLSGGTDKLQVNVTSADANSVTAYVGRREL